MDPETTSPHAMGRTLFDISHFILAAVRFSAELLLRSVSLYSVLIFLAATNNISVRNMSHIVAFLPIMGTNYRISHFTTYFYTEAFMHSLIKQSSRRLPYPVALYHPYGSFCVFPHSIAS